MITKILVFVLELFCTKTKHQYNIWMNGENDTLSQNNYHCQLTKGFPQKITFFRLKIH